MRVVPASFWVAMAGLWLGPLLLLLPPLCGVEGILLALLGSGAVAHGATDLGRAVRGVCRRVWLESSMSENLFSPHTPTVETSESNCSVTVTLRMSFTNTLLFDTQNLYTPRWISLCLCNFLLTTRRRGE